MPTRNPETPYRSLCDPLRRRGIRSGRGEGASFEPLLPPGRDMIPSAVETPEAPPAAHCGA